MALQGTLDGFELAEVMAFLATFRKTGELQVTTGGRRGQMWLDTGSVVAARRAGAEDPTEVLAGLLRAPGGEFTFVPGIVPQVAGRRWPLEDLLAAAEGLVAEWREIDAVVPSLGVRLQVVDNPPGPGVALDADAWRMVVAAARTGGITVREACDAFDWSELVACRTAKVLVDSGLATVAEGVAATAPVPRPVVEPVVEPVAEPVAMPVAMPVAEPYARHPSTQPWLVPTTNDEPARVIDLERAVGAAVPVPAATAEVAPAPGTDVGWTEWQERSDRAAAFTHADGRSYGRQALRDVFQLFRS